MKELPQEVKDALQHNSNMKHTDKQDFGGFTHKRCLDDLTDGAEIAWKHAEESYGQLNQQLKNTLKDVGDLQEYLQRTRQGKLGNSVMKEAAKLLTEKDKEIEKLKGLLKEEVKKSARELVLKHGFAGKAATDFCNETWEAYCKENNIPL